MEEGSKSPGGSEAGDTLHDGTAMLRIQVKRISMHPLHVTVPQEGTVASLKEAIQKAAGVDVHEQRLLFRGRVLRDEQGLQDVGTASGLEDGFAVHMVHSAPDASGAASSQAQQQPSSESQASQPPSAGTQAPSGVPFDLNAVLRDAVMPALATMFGGGNGPAAPARGPAAAAAPTATTSSSSSSTSSSSSVTTSTTLAIAGPDATLAYLGTQMRAIVAAADRAITQARDIGLEPRVAVPEDTHIPDEDATAASGMSVVARLGAVMSRMHVVGARVAAAVDCSSLAMALDASEANPRRRAAATRVIRLAATALELHSNVSFALAALMKTVDMQGEPGAAAPRSFSLRVQGLPGPSPPGAGRSIAAGSPSPTSAPASATTGTTSTSSTATATSSSTDTSATTAVGTGNTWHRFITWLLTHIGTTERLDALLDGDQAMLQSLWAPLRAALCDQMGTRTPSPASVESWVSTISTELRYGRAPCRPASAWVLLVHVVRSTLMAVAEITLGAPAGCAAAWAERVRGHVREPGRAFLRCMPSLSQVREVIAFLVTPWPPGLSMERDVFVQRLHDALMANMLRADAPSGSGRGGHGEDDAEDDDLPSSPSVSPPDDSISPPSVSASEPSSPSISPPDSPSMRHEAASDPAPAATLATLTSQLEASASIVPPEWEATIQRDEALQAAAEAVASTHSQALSDAYVSGMPPQRRKSQQAHRRVAASQCLRPLLRDAIQAAGVHPQREGVEVDDVVREVPATLSRAWEGSCVTQAVQQAAQNPDYVRSGGWDALDQAVQQQEDAQLAKVPELD